MNRQDNSQKEQFSHLPSTWHKVSVDFVADVIDPHPSHRAPEEEPGGIPFAGIGDLNEIGEIQGKKARLVSPEIYVEHNKRYQITENTIGFGRVASIGKIIDFRAQIKKITISPTIALIEPKEKKVDKKFLVQALKSEDTQLQINLLLTGSTRSSLGISLLREIIIPYPPLPEQQKIATILTSVDTVIEKTRAQIDKLKHLKTGMMQQLLTQGIGHTEFKDTPIGRIPKAWRVVQFKDVFTLNYGKSPKDIIAENGANTVWGTGGETAKTNNFLYEGESIVLGRKGTIDQPRYVIGKFWVIDTAYYSSNHGENNVRFLHYALQIKNLKALNEASGVPSLSRDTLYAEWLALPDPLEQKEISKILHSIEVKIAAINKKLSSFEKNKKALMQDLLTGTIRV